jgi:hypothetical protein
MWSISIVAKKKAALRIKFKKIFYQDQDNTMLSTILFKKRHFINNSYKTNQYLFFSFIRHSYFKSFILNIKRLWLRFKTKMDLK